MKQAPPASLADTLTGADLEEYRIGIALARDGDYTNAYDRFNAVYKRTGDPRLLWNMASSLRHSRRYAAVTKLIRQYVSEAEARHMISDAEREAAASLLDTMDTLTAKVSVEVNVAGAAIEVDGEPFATSPMSEAQLTDVGRRKLVVTKEGYQPFAVEWMVDPRTNPPFKVQLIEVVREGKITVRSNVQSAQIFVDEKLVGTGSWTGVSAIGSKSLRVQANGYREYTNDFVLTDNGVRAFDVALVAQKKAVPAWVWIGGAVLLAGGLGTASYFLFRPGETAECANSNSAAICSGGTLGTVGGIIEVK